MSNKIKTLSPSKILAETIVKGMQELKGIEIKVLDLSNISGAVCQFFVICHGESDTQVMAIARAIEKETLKQIKEKPWHTEGEGNAQWILMDYVDVVAHVFYKEAREFYNLEGLWADAPIENIEFQL
ncbi:ribosome silencing factor [Flavobacteriales bacterium]|nr:ribosome silencing factor [Flavobacteriales bacterium]